MIRATVVLSLLFALAAPAAAQREVQRRFPVDPDAYVKVFVQNGSVRVTGWSRDSIAVSGSVDRGSFFAGGQDRSAKLGVWEDDPAGGAARLEVRVPASATVWIKSESAEVRVAGVAGGVDALSVTGDVRIEGAPRRVYAESMGGRIEIAADAASVRAKSAGGAVVFAGRVEDLTLSSVSGPVEARTERPLRARLETVTGAVRWAGGVERGGALDVVTHSGDVELSLPASIDADIAVATVEGSIENGLATGAGTPPGALRARDVELVAGAGGARIAVRTFSGDVSLRPR